MTGKNPHEMSFSEFAEAIRASWVSSVASPSNTPANYAEWLIDVWDTAGKRGNYTIYWHNEALKSALPPEAQKYQFDDLSLYPITARLGLDPESDEDNSKAAEVLAIRNAWVTSIQHHYGQSATAIPSCTLTNAAAAEYVLLTSGLIHPWIQERIRQHKAEQSRKKQEQAIKGEQQIEMSDDPNWPGTRVIHARLPELSPDEVAWRRAILEEKQRNIAYWIECFEFENGRWSSSFEMDAWNAQRVMESLNK